MSIVQASAQSMTTTQSQTTHQRQGRGESPRLHSDFKIERSFCPAGVEDPFETVEWEKRQASINDEMGKPLIRTKGLRNSQELEPTCHECGGQQILLRRGRHRGA